ncbi:MAG TPA: FAD-binding and (Fe-S)-binding domain-containing protein [Solirubrobacteraceae bacterium]|nr:FAD-binding and (Fe-S)-binding domain-containing protein [Solirubrobacteraceae bacterium]
MTATTETVPARVDTRFRGGMAASATVDVRALRRRLEETVQGEVRFDTQSKALYATDASNYRQVPIGVVIPRTLDDVVATHRACHEFGAPIVNRGGGTSLSGETVNFAVVIDHTKYLTEIGDADPHSQTVLVQPGAINEQVNEKTGRQIGMVFGPDPSSHSRCAIGGNIGNNSCGIHSVQSQLYGPGPRTSDNVESMEIVTHDGARFWVAVNEEELLDQIIAEGGRKGEIYARLRDLRDRYADVIRERYQPATRVPRRVSGYNLDELLPERGFNVARALVGTESTCATTLQVKLKLTPALLKRTLVVVEYDELPDAAEHCVEIIDQWKPIGLEGLDHRLIEDQAREGRHVSDLKELPRRDAPHSSWLLVQFGADTAEESEATAQRFKEWLMKKGYAENRIKVERSQQEGGHSGDLWQVREGGLGSTAFPPDGKDHWPGWEDSAVPPEHIGPYVRDLMSLYDKYGYHGAFYGHFGQGCIHSRIDFDLRTAQGIAKYRAFMEEAADLCVSYGGSISGEHGDGQQRAELLEKQYGPELMEAMREFKRIWDPDWKMNPGKVVDPYRLDEHLKLGTDYNPWRPPVRFAYQQDSGDFAHAALRCVGVGKCRVPDASTVMCPSYMVTKEEKDSTRGRARLLFEMLEGEVITDGWQSKEVYDALDLCLACKGCTNDCPVNVDMPTYKSEFWHHHFKSLRRWRPRYAYAFGLIDQAARVASRMPGVVNFFTQTPPFSRIAKFAAGMSPERQIPKFAPMTLQEWFARRGGTQNPSGRRVVLWPDTFNNHFHTDVGVACVEAIEAAGWQVVMPEGHVCCGRPLYDYGFLEMAERYLRHTIEVLREEIRNGTPVVGMEPSCLAVFKDELTAMLPHDDDAKRLAGNAMHFAEFFERFEIDVPALERHALVWGHCHHKATGGMDPEHQLLKRMGVEVEPVSGGCCGLAGSWGFEQGHHEVSMQSGELALLPAVREASPDTVVIANGFSCQTQIAQSDVDRRALHVGQVMKMAREHGSAGYLGGPPELAFSHHRPAGTGSGVRRACLMVTGGCAAAGAGVLAARGARRAMR